MVSTHQNHHCRSFHHPRHSRTDEDVNLPELHPLIGGKTLGKEAAGGAKVSTGSERSSDSTEMRGLGERLQAGVIRPSSDWDSDPLLVRSSSPATAHGTSTNNMTFVTPQSANTPPPSSVSTSTCKTTISRLSPESKPGTRPKQNPRIGRTYTCPACRKAFSRHHDLKRHQALHTGIKPYRCDICERAFARLDALKRHRKGNDNCSGLSVRNRHGVVYHYHQRQRRDWEREDGDLPSDGLRREGGTISEPCSTTTTNTTTTTSNDPSSASNSQVSGLGFLASNESSSGGPKRDVEVSGRRKGCENRPNANDDHKVETICVASSGCCGAPWHKDHHRRHNQHPPNQHYHHHHRYRHRHTAHDRPVPFPSLKRIGEMEPFPDDDVRDDEARPSATPWAGRCGTSALEPERRIFPMSEELPPRSLVTSGSPRSADPHTFTDSGPVSHPIRSPQPSRTRCETESCPEQSLDSSGLRLLSLTAYLQPSSSNVTASPQDVDMLCATNLSSPPPPQPTPPPIKHRQYHDQQARLQQPHHDRHYQQKHCSGTEISEPVDSAKSEAPGNGRDNGLLDDGTISRWLESTPPHRHQHETLQPPPLPSLPPPRPTVIAGRPIPSLPASLANIRALRNELRRERQLRRDYQRKVERLTVQNVKLGIEKSLLRSMVMERNGVSDSPVAGAGVPSAMHIDPTSNEPPRSSSPASPRRFQRVVAASPGLPPPPDTRPSQAGSYFTAEKVLDRSTPHGTQSPAPHSSPHRPYVSSQPICRRLGMAQPTDPQPLHVT